MIILPELSHVTSQGPFPIAHTMDGNHGLYFQIPVIDLEEPNASRKLFALQTVIRDLPTGTRLRVSSRFEAEETRLRTECLLGFERVGSSRPRLFRRNADQSPLVDNLSVEALKSLSAEPLRELALRKLFMEPAAIERKRGHLDSGAEVIGVLRLYRQGTNEISEESLANAISSLPLPFEISVTLTRLSKQETEWKLRSRHARQEGTRDPVSEARLSTTEHAITETALQGRGLTRIEWLIVLRRPSEESLRRDLVLFRSTIKSFGEVLIETVGCVPSFRASLPGSHPHHTFLEFDDTAAVYLPVFAFGESTPEASALAHTLPLQREDGSLHRFDLFSKRFLAYNAIISGKTGSGKSVLANALSYALLRDPSVTMCKIDVGGSYRKECELVGGLETSFSMQRPSGVNPFRFISKTTSPNDVVDTLTTLVTSLLREEGERVPPKSLASVVSEFLKGYAAESREYSLDDFCAWSKPFPRKDLLKRWCRGGVFENALKEADESSSDSRYRYFNFESIQNAANADFAEGVIAAVIASINLEMLSIGEARSSGRRFILVCDETKFFIERNAQFFLLTTANFRKFGHAVILITQKIQNFDLDMGFGRRDSGLILNSPIRFFLEQDTERDYLEATFGLGPRFTSRITENPYRGKEYREAVLQDDTGTRVVRLALSPEEYWRVTSTREDNEKLENLRQAVPGLSLEEAIRCLATV